MYRRSVGTIRFQACEKWRNKYMVHHNPLLAENNGKKFITFGEIMLRLTPPNYEKIRVANNFEASYGGSEANIALSLANLNVDSTFFSVVPNNSLGKSAVRMLRSNDVHCTPVILTGPDETPTHRLGTYYLETGYGIRLTTTSIIWVMQLLTRQLRMLHWTRRLPTPKK
jgi:hypothetical protein